MEDAALEMWELCTTTLLLGCTPAKNELVVIMISCPVNRNDFIKNNEYTARHIFDRLSENFCPALSHSFPDRWSDFIYIFVF